MKKFLLMALAVTMLGGAPVASHAADQDMAKITCKEFLDAKEHMSMMIMWIDGYMSGKSGNTLISDAWMEKLGVHLGPKGWELIAVDGEGGQVNWQNLDLTGVRKITLRGDGTANLE